MKMTFKSAGRAQLCRPTLRAWDALEWTECCAGSLPELEEEWAASRIGDGSRFHRQHRRLELGYPQGICNCRIHALRCLLCPPQRSLFHCSAQRRGRNCHQDRHGIAISKSQLQTHQWGRPGRIRRVQLAGTVDKWIGKSLVSSSIRIMFGITYKLVHVEGADGFGGRFQSESMVALPSVFIVFHSSPNKPRPNRRHSCANWMQITCLFCNPSQVQIVGHQRYRISHTLTEVFYLF